MGTSRPEASAEKIVAARATIEAEIRDIGRRRVALLDETTALRRKIDVDPPHGADLFLAAEEFRIAIESDEVLLWRLMVLKGRLAETARIARAPSTTSAGAAAGSHATIAALTPVNNVRATASILSRATCLTSSARIPVSRPRSPAESSLPKSRGGT